jgi:hypothetical protein
MKKFQLVFENGKAFGKQLNKYGEELDVDVRFDLTMQRLLWEKEENKLRTIEIDEKEYRKSGPGRIWVTNGTDFPRFLIQANFDTFQAEEVDGKLVKLVRVEI